jgi:hypothetical protein
MYSTRMPLESGWHRQAKLGDGLWLRKKAIAKAFGLDDATQRFESTT